MTSPTMWYLNRGSGVVLLVLLTLAVVLGVLATGRSRAPLWPAFVTQGLHRSLAGVSVLLLAGHAVSAVVDEYVDIRWWHALVPVGATYHPLALGLGTLALDALGLVTLTSVARDRLPHRLWFGLHLLTYAAWSAAVVHGLLIGTDAGRGWLQVTNAACVVAVALAGAARIIAVRRGEARSSAASLPTSASTAAASSAAASTSMVEGAR